jgi:hypothetical protein
MQAKHYRLVVGLDRAAAEYAKIVALLAFRYKLCPGAFLRIPMCKCIIISWMRGFARAR